MNKFGFIRSKALFQIIIIICSTFYFVMLLDSLNVKAADVCCEKSGNAYCQSFGALFPGDVDNCDSSGTYAFSKCEKTDFCKPGCCIKDSECYPNVAKAACLGENGIYNTNTQCNLPQCEKHCCQVGKEYFMATSEQCKSAIANYPDVKFSDAFDTSISSEAECIGKYMLAEKGCCVSGDTCKFATGEECVGLTGSLDNFNKDTYCSAIESCGCEAKDTKGCVDYDSNLYWFDSCGNPEDIAEECNFDEGFICGDVDGEKVCKNVNCLETYMPPEGTNLHDPYMGGERMNGESWCVYDSAVGSGYDRPGSRHYRHMCINGEEIVEACRDYREEVCVQGTAEIPVGEEEVMGYTEAMCVPNTEEEGGNTPMLDVPLGSRFWENENEAQCAFDPEVKCTVVYKREKKCEPDPGNLLTGISCEWGDWECIEGCECESEVAIADFEGAQEIAEKWGFKSPPCIGEDQPIESGEEENTEWSEEGVQESENQVSEENTEITGEAITSITGEQEVNLEDVQQGECDPSLEIPCEDYISDTTEYTEGETQFCKNTKGMNWVDSFADVCRKKGDCGAYVNVAGARTTEGFNVVIGGDPSLEGGYSEGWKNTGELGPNAGATVDELKEFAPELWDDWSKYGVFGMVKELGELLFNLNLPDTGAEWNTGAGIVLVASLIYTYYATAAVAAATAAVAGTAAATAPLWAIPVVGWIIAIIMLLIILFTYKKVEIKHYQISLECLPWQAPEEEQACEFYNDNKFVELSEYTCRSLGKNCVLINEETEQASCTYMEQQDYNSPIISSWGEIFTEGYEPVNEQLNVGFELNKMVEPFMPITIGIKTDEPSQCMMGTKPGVMFDQMVLPFGDFVYKTEHNVTFRALPIDKEYTYYIRCADYWGNTNMKDYVIKFNVDKGPDLTAPIIETTSPGNNANVKYGEVIQKAILLLNEPAQCKWSTTQNNPYAGMTNSFTCANDINYNLNGQYACMIDLPVKPESRNTYYVRCEDLNGNQNQQDYIYTLIGSGPLQILDVQPTGQIYESEFTLTATTNSPATCSYNGDVFFNTGGTTHTQEMSPPLGSRTYLVECTDTAGNTATKQVIIMKMIDDMGPRIMRIYFDGGYLHVETNEGSICEYDSKEFSFGSGIKMPTDKTTQHTVTSILDVYYVMCADDYGNMGELAVIHP